MKDNSRKEALKWLNQAQEELTDAAELCKRKRFYLSLFLCQQSAEKALKAYLYFKEREPIFTRSVSSLLGMAIQIEEKFKSVSPAKRLDDYYIPTRYPNGVPEEIPAKYYDDQVEAEQALKLCKQVLDLVSKMLSCFDDKKL